MAKRKNKDIDVLYGIFGKLESNLCEEELRFLKSCIRKSFLTKRKIEEWILNSISYRKRKKQIEYEHKCFHSWLRNFLEYLRFIFPIKITTILFSLEIWQKDMFLIKYQPLCFHLEYYKKICFFVVQSLCFPLRVLQKRIVIRRDMFPRGK